MYITIIIFLPLQNSLRDYPLIIIIIFFLLLLFSITNITHHPHTNKDYYPYKNSPFLPLQSHSLEGHLFFHRRLLWIQNSKCVLSFFISFCLIIFKKWEVLFHYSCFKQTYKKERKNNNILLLRLFEKSANNNNITRV